MARPKAPCLSRAFFVVFGKYRLKSDHGGPILGYKGLTEISKRGIPHQAGASSVCQRRYAKEDDMKKLWEILKSILRTLFGLPKKFWGILANLFESKAFWVLLAIINTLLFFILVGK